MEPVKLQEWANANKPDDQMFYKNSYWSQIVFVRNVLPGALAPIGNYEIYKAIVDDTVVISTHISKSILLPVFELNYHSAGLKFIMRDNFHDWKVSVISTHPIRADFGDIINTKQSVPSVYCEGFSSPWIFGSYYGNPNQFTVEVQDNYRLFTFVWLISQALSLQ